MKILVFKLLININNKIKLNLLKIEEYKIRKLL
jgi:hypothetical protein